MLKQEQLQSKEPEEQEEEEDLEEEVEIEEEVEEEEEEEEEDSVEEVSKKNGLHLQNSEDSLNPETFNNLKKFTPTQSQLKKHKLLIDFFLTLTLNLLMKSCALCLFKNKLKPVKEPDSRLLLLLETEEDMLESVLKLQKKYKLPLKEDLLMQNSISSQ
jgi:hypothetical protein